MKTDSKPGVNTLEHVRGRRWTCPLCGQPNVAATPTGKLRSHVEYYGSTGCPAGGIDLLAPIQPQLDRISGTDRRGTYENGQEHRTMDGG